MSELKNIQYFRIPMRSKTVRSIRQHKVCYLPVNVHTRIKRYSLVKGVSFQYDTSIIVSNGAYIRIEDYKIHKIKGPKPKGNKKAIVKIQLLIDDWDKDFSNEVKLGIKNKHYYEEVLVDWNDLKKDLAEVEDYSLVDQIFFNLYMANEINHMW